jgi:CubicO group peptidase (beta-lactamase class C family)
MIKKYLALLCLSLALAVVPVGLSSQADVATAVEPKVDAVFAKWSSSTPGCAVGVATNGKPALTKGYGMADLEHDVKIAPDTIFEAGSVSKQFTAAAVLLLAREGKLSLDDQVRKYIPELPDYPPPPGIDTPGYGQTSPKPQAAKAGEALGAPKPQSGGGGLTIRHMLNHTSGLRDWGSVAGIAGWPRTTRVHTHAHVLDIVSRQRATNFTPGTHWSYSNTGFNLAAIIVSRVSNMPFPEFSRTRLFQPVGMTHTSWRDDYTRIVKGRAVAYNSKTDGYHTLMPFENVYGNGGLLTTVGDLLKWNENFVSPVVGDAAFVAEQQTPGRFNDGRTHGYALGLFVGTYKGLREVYHGGSTAGYQAFLTRFPDQRVSVAVLCNSSSAQATQYAHAVADAYLADRLKPASSPATLTSAQMEEAAGMYRSALTGLPLMVGGERDTLRGRTWTFDGHGGATASDAYGTIEAYERVDPAKPTAQQLSQLAGTYASEDAETSMIAAVENGALVLKHRPDVTIKLTPMYADVFGAGPLGTVIFRRDGSGRAIAFSVVQDRVWDMRFERVSQSSIR